MRVRVAFRQQRNQPELREPRIRIEYQELACFQIGGRLANTCEEPYPREQPFDHRPGTRIVHLSEAKLRVAPEQLPQLCAADHSLRHRETSFEAIDYDAGDRDVGAERDT